MPQLNNVNINKENCKIDVTTSKSQNQRRYLDFNRKSKFSKKFENNIICLIEAKHRNVNIGDYEWKDAMKQGSEKAPKQKLNYFIVTNCNGWIIFKLLLNSSSKFSLILLFLVLTFFFFNIMRNSSNVNL